MAEQHNSDARRRRRRRRGGRPAGAPGQSSNQEPSGLNKFLSIITFGLLGKPKPKPSSRPQPAPPVRFEGDRPERPQHQKKERQPREGRPPREPRPAPTPTEVVSERLYVGNLSYDASESDLFELFNGVGRVQNAEVVVNTRTQRSKGFAFVTMATVDEAKRAVAELNNKDFMGRAMQVSGAKPPQRDREDRQDDSSAGATEAAEDQAQAAA